jgi:hypothetical protein
VAHKLLNWPLNALLAGLTLLTPVTIHLFFPVIPVVKADFGLSDALAQLTFSAGEPWASSRRARSAARIR